MCKRLVTIGRFKPQRAGRQVRRALTLCCGLVWLITAASLSANAAVPTQERSQCVRRAESLLARMSLEEKIGQMTQVDMNALKEQGRHQKIFPRLGAQRRRFGPGGYRAKGWAKAVEEFQSWAFKTRLKIPLLYGIDAVHGHNNVDGAVIFPHNIGLGATRNPSSGRTGRPSDRRGNGRHRHPVGLCPVHRRGAKSALGANLRKLRRDRPNWRSCWARRGAGIAGKNSWPSPLRSLACAKHFHRRRRHHRRNRPGEHRVR